MSHDRFLSPRPAFPGAALSLAVPLALSLVLGAAAPARAAVTLPDCPAMTKWAGGYDKNAKWEPNDLGSRHWFPAIFAAPETAEVFGKPVLEWTPDEAKSIATALKTCERALSKEKRYRERNAVSDVKTWASRNVANYLEKSAAARGAYDTAFAALAQAKPSPGLLAFYTGMAKIGDGRKGYDAAQRATAQLAGDVQKAARAALSSARDLPQAELDSRIAPAAAARIDSQRTAVRAAIEVDIANMPVSIQGLDALSGMRKALAKDYADVFPREDVAAITGKIGTRETAIGTRIADMMIADIESASDGMPAFNNIATQLNSGLLQRLPPAQAARVRAAASAKAEAVGNALMPAFRKNLADLPVEDASIDSLDGPTLAYVRESLAPAPAVRVRFEQAVAARRSEIVAALTKAEAGAMRGRHYADRAGRIKMEFVDRTRVFVTAPDGQTAAGTYTEEKDGRVVVTLPNTSMVLTREGRRLTGGPVELRRVDAN